MYVKHNSKAGTRLRESTTINWKIYTEPQVWNVWNRTVAKTLKSLSTAITTI